MTMKRAITFAVVSACLMASTGYAQKYPVHEPKDRVGGKYSIASTTARKQQSSSSKAGRVLQTQLVDFQVTLEGVVEVLAVDKFDRAYKESITVTKFTKAQNGIVSGVAKPGTVYFIDGSQPEGKQVTMKGGLPDAATQEALLTAKPAHVPDSFGEDGMFDVKEPKAVGDTWPIDKAKVVENMKSSMIIPIDRISGSTTVIAKSSIDDHECLNIVGELKADGVKLVRTNPATTPELGTVEVNTNACNPISDTIAQKANFEMKVYFQTKGKVGTPYEGLVLEVTSTQSNSLLMREVKP
jgi:hypothetical protein